MRDLFVRAARGERTERPPVWLMRQAGRHLPEYRAIRADYTFREAISTPEVATEISLQPVERYGVDGAVIFSDILTVLEPLGFDYHIESGVGPVIENPVEGPADATREVGDVREELAYVGEVVDRVSTAVGEDAATIGFAGGPFTLASYVTAGEPTRTHMPLRRLRASDPAAFETLLSTFATVVREYLEMQVDRGADVVQLFDTYAGALTPADYREHLLGLHREILADLSVPTIVFARHMGGRLDLLAESGADVVALDWTVDMADARAELGDVAVQGNLDPADLMGGPEHVRARTREVIEAAGPAGHILNLGHGVSKDTPIEGVEAFVETAKAIDR